MGLNCWCVIGFWGKKLDRAAPGDLRGVAVKKNCNRNGSGAIGIEIISRKQGRNETYCRNSNSEESDLQSRSLQRAQQAGGAL